MYARMYAISISQPSVQRMDKVSCIHRAEYCITVKMTEQLYISMDGSHKTMVSDKIETEKNTGSDASQKNYITSPIGTISLRGIYIGGEAIR